MPSRDRPLEVKNVNEQPMETKNLQFWQVTIFPMPERIVQDFNWPQLVSLAKDKKTFPNVSGFALVNGFVRQRTDQGYTVLVYHGALKIYGYTKRRRLRDRIQIVINAELGASHKVEVRGISGWDRLCKRIFAEGFTYRLIRNNIDGAAFREDEEEYRSLVEQFMRKPGRQRRRLETYMDMKRGARRKSRPKKVLRPRGYRLAGKKRPVYKPAEKKPPGDKPP